MTTKELADTIGVSRIRLSKVLNGAGGVAPETEKKIWKYVHEYNFVPNSQARSLVGKKECIIGFFSTYSKESAGAADISSHFSTEMTNLVIDSAQKRGYKTLVSLTEEDRDFNSVERFLNSGLVRGAILLGYATGSDETQRIAARGYPLVLVNQERECAFDNVTVVNMDDRNWAFCAIEKLVQYGHRRLLYLGCTRPRLPALRRHEGVQAAVSLYQNCIDSFSVLDGDFSEMRAYQLIHDIYSAPDTEKPTGIFAANDIMAIGAINALKELNYRIPQDVSVIGFDDISISRYLSPALTTMRCDFSQIAETCVTSLIDLIEHRPTSHHIEMPVEFMARGTLDWAKNAAGKRGMLEI